MNECFTLLGLRNDGSTQWRRWGKVERGQLLVHHVDARLELLSLVLPRERSFRKQNATDSLHRDVWDSANVVVQMGQWTGDNTPLEISVFVFDTTLRLLLVALQRFRCDGGGADVDLKTWWRLKLVRKLLPIKRLLRCHGVLGRLLQRKCRMNVTHNANVPCLI